MQKEKRDEEKPEDKEEARVGTEIDAFANQIVL